MGAQLTIILPIIYLIIYLLYACSRPAASTPPVRPAGLMDPSAQTATIAANKSTQAASKLADSSTQTIHKPNRRNLRLSKKFFTASIPPNQSFAEPEDTGTPHECVDDCAFCEIANNYPPWSPEKPPRITSDTIRPTKVYPAAWVVLSTPSVLAFLDINPLAEGHLLLVPRSHRPQVTHLTAQEAREMGRWQRILSAAARRVTKRRDFNLVQNNGISAHQTVFHAHFHIIPRWESPMSWASLYGRGVREALDLGKAPGIAEDLRKQIASLLTIERNSGELV